MMTHRQITGKLDDYVDGLLDPAETEEISRHLAGCPECAREVAQLRALLAEAAGLSPGIEPERDLWPGIAEAIGKKSASVSRMRLVAGSGPARRNGDERLRTSIRGLLLAAAALALVMLMPATVTRHLPGLLDVGPAVTVDAADLLAASYSSVRTACAESFAENAELMDPRTIVAFQAGVAAADQATAELKAALELAGNDPGMTRMLTEGYMRKISLVRRLDRHAATL